MTFERVSYDDVSERALFSMGLDSFDDPFPTMELPTKYFVCLLAADFSNVSVTRISDVALTLVSVGCCYFLCWGPGCERAHDIIDETLAAANLDVIDDSVIMTTWHDDETLDEALFFLLTCAMPDDKYFEMTGASVAVSVGNEKVLAQIRTALEDPRGFVRKVVDAEDGAA